MSDINSEDVLSAENMSDNQLCNDENTMLSDSESSSTVYSWAELDNDVCATAGSDTVYIGANLNPTNQILINRNVTIIGMDGIYVGGSSSSNSVSYSYIPIYSDVGGLSITLKNIRFQNCGGNILMQFGGNGYYCLENCTFENCTATGDHQSIVYLNQGYANITGCTFEKCRTSFGALSNYNPSSVDNVHMTVKDTIFRNNNASVEPGAINNCGHLEVYDSTFEANSANWWAGAIHTHINATTSIVRSNFKKNIAGWNGGALYTYSYLTVVDSTFDGNEAHGVNGGAIAASPYGSKPYISIEGCNFNNNIAYGSGGAISFGSGNLTVRSSNFNNNTAGSNGGAISSAYAITTISRCDFKNNIAYGSGNEGNGGAIYASDTGRLIVKYCLFANNTAKDDYSGHSIAYYYTGTTSSVAYLTYYNNEFYDGEGSVSAGNTYLTIAQHDNSISDYSQYNVVEQENSNNTPAHSSVIPDWANSCSVIWNVTLSESLSGTPVIEGNRVLIPASHTLYCYSTDGTYCWNVTSEYGFFHELIVDNGVIFAPCSWDRLYILDLASGISVTNSNIYQGSSLYAPVIGVDGTIYVSSEYGYGEYHHLWISMIKYVNGEFVYYDSILEIGGVPYGSAALLSQPIIDNQGNLFVNTIEGLKRIDMNTGYINTYSNTIGRPVIGDDGTVYCLVDANGCTQIISIDSTGSSAVFGTVYGECELLLYISDLNSVFTVTDDGYVYCIDEYGLYRLWDDELDFYLPHVSAQMAYFEETTQIYVGDDSGILWLFDYRAENYPIYTISEFIFNATSPIVGGISVDANGYAYFGTADGNFFVVSNI